MEKNRDLNKESSKYIHNRRSAVVATRLQVIADKHNNKEMMI